jgi:hypothetical protein
LKSHSISGVDGQAQQFGANHLTPIGCQPKTDETGLQTGYHRIEYLFQGITLKAVPFHKCIFAGELLAVKQAGLAARETPFIGLMEEVSFQYQQVWNDAADLLQIEIVPARGSIFGPNFFPEAKQHARTGMHDLGIGLACFFIVVNYHRITPRAEAASLPVPIMNFQAMCCRGHAI